MSETTGEPISPPVSALMALTDADRQVALERFRLLRPYLEGEFP